MAVAFKEWQVVCDALASGRQTIILRKGGIHEGREGFSFAHDSFLLFPTKFHAQIDQVREGIFAPEREWQIGDSISLTHHTDVLFAATLTNWNAVEALFPYHVFNEETLRERFDWQGKGMASGSINVAFVRVSKLGKPIDFIYEKRFGGCRSWLDLPEVTAEAIEQRVPVIPHETFTAYHAKISEICENAEA